MNLAQFLKFDDNDKHEISRDEAQSLNKDLATKTLSVIPESRRSRVLDYLITALNMNSVEHDIQAKLESLVADLQNDTF